jgi:hypothetical protein
MRMLTLFCTMVITISFAHAGRSFDGYGESKCHLVDKKSGSREDFRLIIAKSTINRYSGQGHSTKSYQVDVTTVTKISQDGSISQAIYGGGDFYISKQEIKEAEEAAFKASQNSGKRELISKFFSYRDPLDVGETIRFSKRKVVTIADHSIQKLKMGHVDDIIQVSVLNAGKDEFTIQKRVGYEYFHSVGVALEDHEKDYFVSSSRAEGICTKIK